MYYFLDDSSIYSPNFSDLRPSTLEIKMKSLRKKFTFERFMNRNLKHPNRYSDVLAKYRAEITPILVDFVRRK